MSGKDATIDEIMAILDELDDDGQRLCNRLAKADSRLPWR